VEVPVCFNTIYKFPSITFLSNFNELKSLSIVICEGREFNYIYI
jgi:hypothetical protein